MLAFDERLEGGLIIKDPRIAIRELTRSIAFILKWKDDDEKEKTLLIAMRNFRSLQKQIEREVL